MAYEKGSLKITGRNAPWFLLDFLWRYGKITTIPKGIRANQAYILRRYVQHVGVEPLSDRKPSCGWRPGHSLLRNLSNETLSDSHTSQAVAIHSNGWDTFLWLGHWSNTCLLRAFTGATAVPQTKQYVWCWNVHLRDPGHEKQLLQELQYTLH